MFHRHFWKIVHCWTEAFGEPAMLVYIHAWNRFLLVLHCYKRGSLGWQIIQIFPDTELQHSVNLLIISVQTGASRP